MMTNFPVCPDLLFSTFPALTFRMGREGDALLDDRGLRLGELFDDPAELVGAEQLSSLGDVLKFSKEMVRVSTPEGASEFHVVSVGSVENNGCVSSC